jgi:predicted MFS family arabinose efflux permease
MKPARYAWFVVAVLWLVWLLNYLDRQVIFSLFPLLRTELSLSDVQLGLLGTAFLWVYAFASPFAGYLGDRFNRKYIVVVSLAVWSAVTWFTAYARNFGELIVARGLMGISEACYLPAGLALIADYHGPKTRSRATGLHYTGGYIGMVLGGFAGGYFGQRYGWRPVFVVLGVIGLIYTLWIFATMRDPAPPDSEGSEPAGETGNFAASIGELLRTPGYVTLTLVFTIVGICNWMVYTWMPMYLYEHFHLTLAQAGFAATFYLQAGSLGGTALGGWLADRWSRVNPRGRQLTQAIGLLAAAPFLFLTGIAGAPAVLYIGLTVFGIGRGFYDCNCMPVLCQIARPALRGSGFGVFNCASCIAGGLAAVGAGALKSTIGLGGSLAATGMLLFVSSLMLLRLRLREGASRA